MSFEQHPFGAPRRYLDLSSASVPYWRAGRGPHLVFVHGWPLDARTWRNVVAHLSADHTCHLFDLPGAGWSRWSPYASLEVPDLPGLVAEAVSLMDLEDQDFVFVGHDSGGGFARMSVLESGKAPAGFVLGNTETPRRYTPIFRWLFKLGKTPLVKLSFLHLCRRKKTRQLFCLGRRWSGSRLEQELTEYFVDPLVDYPAKLEAALSLLRKARASDFDRLTEAHARIEAPVRFLWGARDPWFLLEHAQDMLSEFAGEATLQVEEKASLLVHEEEPERFAGLVRELVGELGL